MKSRLTFLLFLTLFFSCSSGNEQETGKDQLETHYSSSNENSNFQDEEEKVDETQKDSEEERGIQDGTYSATVDYNNPNTGYSATYTLDVEVEAGEVTIIYFPNDGYLDSDHISPTELDENGYAEIDGEDGKTYQVQIDL